MQSGICLTFRLGFRGPIIVSSRSMLYTFRTPETFNGPYIYGLARRFLQTETFAELTQFFLGTLSFDLGTKGDQLNRRESSNIFSRS